MYNSPFDDYEEDTNGTDLNIITFYVRGGSFSFFPESFPILKFIALAVRFPLLHFLNLELDPFREEDMH